MGYLVAIALCVRCRALMSFNPDRVPSVVVKGERQPLCRACVEWANPRRVARGLDPIPVLPGAYEPTEA